MVRAPCCEKMGLKKGPWTPQEDQILTSYIQNFGHGNWRALPKQAGLLRCGKSCRLRWINYLQPDIKRGNYSTEEEETIIKLHEMLGNKWSTIAARLPGRTDNEIKNVWHTHLKKRLKQNQATTQNPNPVSKCDFNSNFTGKSEPTNSDSPMSPQPSSSTDCWSSVTDNSVVTQDTNATDTAKHERFDSPENFPEIDESFWSDASVLVDNNSSNNNNMSEFSTLSDELQLQFPLTSMEMDNGMEFWYELFVRAGDLENEMS